MDYRLELIPFAEIDGWSEGDCSTALRAFAQSARYAAGVKPYRTGSLGIPAQSLAALLPQLPEPAEAVSPDEARRFFEAYFTPARIILEAGQSGFVTGYYEPHIAVSSTPDASYRFPIYRQPVDLVAADPHTSIPEALASFAYVRQRQDGALDAYPDRAAIEQGYLAGRGLEIAWARDRVDLFFVHIQGAARLIFADGGQSRITYAAKNGHPFTPIGRILAGRGLIDGEDVTMQSIRAWLAANPECQDDILWLNRSFILFREIDGPDADAPGPVAAAKVPLTAGRSLAVDRLIHTFGTPLFVSSPTLHHLDGAPFRRLMIAQDTGTAIVGAARGDLYVGSGDAPGLAAGRVKHAADFTILVPTSAAHRVGL